MISAAQANARLARWSGKTDLIFKDSIEGEVRVLAGNSGRIVFEKPIIGTLVIGGFARDDARSLVLDTSREQVIEGNGMKRVGGHYLRPEGKGERVKIAYKLTVEAELRGMLYAKYAVDSTFILDIDGRGMERSHGALFEWCADCRASGSVANVGDSTAEKTGQSYALGIQSCTGMLAHDLWIDAARHGVSLFGGGERNTIQRVRGNATVALAELHGMDQEDLTITGVEGRVKLYNETWKGRALGAIVAGYKSVDWGSR